MFISLITYCSVKVVVFIDNSEVQVCMANTPIHEEATCLIFDEKFVY